MRAWVTGLALLATAACGSDPGAPEGDGAVVEWHEVAWPKGTVRLAVLQPSPNVGPGPHPVLFALPWGSGSPDLLLGFMDAYWSVEPARRGYYVVGLVGRASDMADVGEELLPSIFQWMDQNLTYDRERVALVGASNGGRGAFWAALAHPHRFAALAALPGRYEGAAADAASLAHMPVGLWVGEFDASWLEAAQSTVETLTAGGVDVTLDVVPGQGHVILMPQGTLMDWIDAALGR